MRCWLTTSQLLDLKMALPKWKLQAQGLHICITCFRCTSTMQPQAPFFKEHHQDSFIILHGNKNTFRISHIMSSSFFKEISRVCPQNEISQATLGPLGEQATNTWGRTLNEVFIG
uniref:Uncharacterized protein n=1 Tax=Opuntia streptacantha TaxID=393608 RepID=A0A7C9EC73_OPUST